jgi:asparagine synthase (glutamine-hydrolysing)
VTVALSGQGADELLGGYRKHQIAHAGDLARRSPVPLGRALAAAARLAPDGSTAARGLAAIATDDPAERLLAMSRVVQAHEREELFTRDFLVPGAEEEIRRAVSQHLNGRRLSVLGETLHLDRRLALVDNMLLYFDKISMAASLEVRVPFMDHRVVSFCVALPDDRLIRGSRRKEILRQASRGLVDDAIIDKKKRGFFHSALGSWLRVHRESLFSELMLDERSRGRAHYRDGAVRELVAAAGEEGKKAGQRLFCLLLLEKWQRMFVDPDGRARRLSAGG